MSKIGHTPQNGQQYPEYRLPKDLTLTLVAGYRADLRYKLVKRLEELEDRAAKPALPDFSDPVVAARAWADALERKQAAETRMIEAQRIVADLTLKAEAFDRLDTAEGNLTVRPASKVLGYMESKLSKWMELNGWAFRQNGKGPIQPYSDKRKAGLLDHKLRHFEDSRTGEPRVEATLTITPKGMARLAQILPKEGGAQ